MARIAGGGENSPVLDVLSGFAALHGVIPVGKPPGQVVLALGYREYDESGSKVRRHASNFDLKQQNLWEFSA